MSDPIGPKPREHYIDQTLITEFGKIMVEKMRKNKHKAHWSTVSQSWLLKRLAEEMVELSDAILMDGDVVAEAADVANIAAMIADNHMNGK